MTVINNPAAMMTLGELNKNISRAGKDLRKIASGQKINGAGDGASEKMRVRLRALGQDSENVQKGASLLHLAEGGI